MKQAKCLTLLLCYKVEGIMVKCEVFVYVSSSGNIALSGSVICGKL
jgi:hypothetical protein